MNGRVQNSGFHKSSSGDMEGRSEKKAHTDAQEMVSYARALYEKFDHDRSAVASMIKGSPYEWAGFEALNSDRTAEEILKEIKPSRLEKLIREYGI